MAAQLVSQKTIARERVKGRFKLNNVKINVFLDLILTLTFVVEMEEHFTGLPLHEVLGVLFAVAFTLHILLHWRWIVSLTRTFFKKLLHESRLNYVLNLVLFVDMVAVTVSGLLISRTLGLNFSLEEDLHRTLQEIHLVGSELALLVVALHVAMHWKWIKTHGSKYLLGWLPTFGTRKR